MSTSGQRFVITPLLLDFGTRVVALSHVARAEAGQQRPYRHLGIALIVAAFAGIGVELARAGVPQLGSGGSTGLWLSFLVAGLGIFALVFQRRFLLIALDDGARLRFTASRQEFLVEVVHRIGEALAAPPGATLRYAVDVGAETITAADGATVAPPRSAPPDLAARIDPQPAAEAVPADTRTPAAMAPAAEPAQRQFEASLVEELAKAAAASHQSRQRPAATTVPLNRAGRTAARPAAAVAASAPAIASGPGYASTGAAASVAALSPPTEPDAAHELDALIALVTRSPVQHKAALLDLLRVVGDFLKDGRGDAEDALAHWQSFSSYVYQYLTDVDGLAAMTSRTGRRVEAAIAH